MTKAVEAYQCEVCNSLHDHPSLATKCESQCRLYYLIRDIGEEITEDDDVQLSFLPEVDGDISENGHLHSKLFIRDVVEALETQLEYLQNE